MRDVHMEVPPNRLRQLLREHPDVKLVDVAALCRVDQSTAFRWQDGTIPRPHVAKVARLLGVSVPYLDGWTDSERAA
jgi:hypothetical protein